MLSTLGVENRIKVALSLMNCSINQFVSITKAISQQRLSAALNGEKALSNEVGTMLEEHIRELQELVESYKPISIDFRNVTGVQLALHQRRNNKAA